MSRPASAYPPHAARRQPSAYDRVLATQLGSYAAGLVADEHYGVTVAMVNRHVTANPLADIAGKTRRARRLRYAERRPRYGHQAGLIFPQNIRFCRPRHRAREFYVCGAAGRRERRLPYGTPKPLPGRPCMVSVLILPRTLFNRLKISAPTAEPTARATT